MSVGQRAADSAELHYIGQRAAELDEAAIASAEQQARWSRQGKLEPCGFEREVLSLRGDGLTRQQRHRGAHDCFEPLDSLSRRWSLATDLTPLQRRVAR